MDEEELKKLEEKYISGLSDPSKLLDDFDLNSYLQQIESAGGALTLLGEEDGPDHIDNLLKEISAPKQEPLDLNPIAHGIESLILSLNEPAKVEAETLSNALSTLAPGITSLLSTITLIQHHNHRTHHRSSFWLQSLPLRHQQCPVHS